MLTAVLMTAMLIATMLIATGCAQSGAPAGNTGATGDSADAAEIDWEFYNGRAKEFVTAMSAGDFNAAVEMFDKTMKRALPAKSLQTGVWDVVTGQAGAFVSINKTENQAAQGYFICFVTSEHADKGVTLRVVFSKDGQVAGLFIDGYPDINERASEPVRREGFTDYPVTIGEGTEYPLSGLLSMPDSETGKVPAVVIVHGSGPQDMDLTISGNKPYKDIADYLAANGIAVIRYDKRTYAYKAKFDLSWTVREETIEDAIRAANMLKADSRIDENRVYIIGHSMGGMLAPRIQAEGGGFAGLILLAGSPRSMLDISKAQNIKAVEAMADGKDKDAAMASLEQWDEYYNSFLRLPDAEAKTTEVPGWGGASAYYFKDMNNHPAADYIKETDVPFLILQGANDLQVYADVDFTMYKDLLAGRPNVTYKLYDGLNHLFMQSAAKSIAELNDEYAVPGHVDSRVLADIADWIKSVE